MSISTKSIIIFLVVVLVIAGLWYVLAGKSQSVYPQNSAVSQSVTTSTGQPRPSDSVSTRDNSNASLDQDLSSVDAQLNAINSNSASVDQSLNDTPVSQTE
jgi:hypothetical protein